MSTPVLTVKQQKQTLSHKKRKSKITVKNVLASPYSNYWPLLQPEDEENLKNVLNEHLVTLKAPKVKIPYKELIKVERSERKEFRKNYMRVDDDTESPIGGEGKEENVTFGINAVTKLIESECASSILISGDVNPQFMVKHVIDSAIVKKVPVLVMPNLKFLLKEKTGIASAAVAFGNKVSSSRYSSIDAKIKALYCKYCVPPEHPLVTREKYVANRLCSGSGKRDSDDEVEMEGETKVKDLYLYRNSMMERVFKPELSKQAVCDLGQADENFVSLGSNSIKQTPKRVKSKVTASKVSYKSLLVKRVVSNSNRDMTKMEMLKKRKRE